MAQENEDKKVALYFVGGRLMEQRRRFAPQYNIKGRIYAVPSHVENGDVVLDVGKSIDVYERDVEELMMKSRINTEHGQVYTFTKNADLAASVKRAWDAGQVQNVPVELTVQQAASFLSPETLRERALQQMSTDDLRKLLEEREALEKQPGEDEKSEDDDQPEAESKPKSTSKSKPTPPPVMSK